jgi:hypothetical protein
VADDPLNVEAGGGSCAWPYDIPPGAPRIDVRGGLGWRNRAALDEITAALDSLTTTSD